MASIARLSQMPESQYAHSIVGLFMPVQGNVARCAERNYEFPQLRLIRVRAANVGRVCKQLELPFYGLLCPLGCVRVFGCQELAASLQAAPGASRDDYLWHSGIALSSSVPQVRNQANTSSPVRCKPVS